MTADTTRRLSTAIIFMTVCIAASLCYEFIGIQAGLVSFGADT